MRISSCGTSIGLAYLSLVAWALPVPAETVLYRFKTINDGRNPNGGLIIDTSGTLYGTTLTGGPSDGNPTTERGHFPPHFGTAFKLTPPAAGQTEWFETVLYAFKHTAFKGVIVNDGAFPSRLVVDSEGALYGTTVYGAFGLSGFNLPYEGFGTVFKLTPPSAGKAHWTETALYRFAGTADGAHPSGRLAIDSAGALYGTTSSGGTVNNFGTIFKLTPPAAGKTYWTWTVLARFTANGGLTLDNKGALYGTTKLGGSRNFGTVFKLTPPAVGQTRWTKTVLYNFKGANSDDGAYPNGDIIFDNQGALYGTTEGHDLLSPIATVFKLTPPAAGQTQWTETVLYRFRAGTNGKPDGALLTDALVWDKNGALYGTLRRESDAHPFGTVFKLTPRGAREKQWTSTILHRFAGGADGEDPIGGLTVSTDGTALYGTTRSGGTKNGGTVFQIAIQ
jgi:uncharacterized repeat protein (TIGR03803 family)